MMRRILSSVLLAISVSSVNAALIDRGNGLIYDTDLDITWLQDANYAMTSGYDDDGLMTFNIAKSWANQLDYAGFTEWRLATVEQNDPTCGQDGIGYRYGYNCSGGEYGHLFYNELGGIALQHITTSSDPDVSLFTNIMDGNYWADTYMASVSFDQWYGTFNFDHGEQNTETVGTLNYAWAVHDGDIGASVVPVPTAIWLFGSGLVGLLTAARRKS